MDEVHSVIEYVEMMCVLLVHEREENSQQGHCLVYLLTGNYYQPLSVVSTSK